MEDKQTGNGDSENLQSVESLDAPDDSQAGAAKDGAADLEAAAPAGGDTGDTLASPDSGGAPAKPPKKPHRLLHSANLYLIGFIVLILIAVGVVILAYSKSHNQSKSQNISSQNLSPQALQQLASSDVNVGSSNQLLTVQSNAIFTGQVLAQKNFQVAGNLTVGGNLSLPRVVVSGTSQFGSVQVNQDLSVAGNSAIQGALSIKGAFSAGGGGSFGGNLSAPQLTVNSLDLNGDLTLLHHISAGGSTPRFSRGPAVGSGGVASLSGSDTAGNISISTGGSPPAGCFITIFFAQAFHATPHVVVTPVGSAAGGLQYYVNRSSSQFSVCTDSSAPAGASFGFDYIAFD